MLERIQVRRAEGRYNVAEQQLTALVIHRDHEVLAFAQLLQLASERDRVVSERFEARAQRLHVPARWQLRHDEANQHSREDDQTELNDAYGVQSPDDARSGPLVHLSSGASM